MFSLEFLPWLKKDLVGPMQTLLMSYFQGRIQTARTVGCLEPEILSLLYPVTPRSNN